MGKFSILGALLADDCYRMIHEGNRISDSHTAPRMPKNGPVEDRDFLGNVGALWATFFGIVGADCPHCGNAGINRKEPRRCRAGKGRRTTRSGDRKTPNFLGSLSALAQEAQAMRGARF